MLPSFLPRGPVCLEYVILNHITLVLLSHSRTPPPPPRRFFFFPVVLSFTSPNTPKTVVRDRIAIPMESPCCQSDPDSSPLRQTSPRAHTLSLSVSLSPRLSVSCLATGLGVLFVASFQKCHGFKCAPLQARHPQNQNQKNY
jgi:hypothetical protein